MPSWKRTATAPSGALPANLVTKVGVLLITALLVALIISSSLTSEDPTDAVATPTAADEQPLANSGFVRGIRNRIAQQQRDHEQQQLAEARELQRERMLAERDAGDEPFAGPLPGDPASGEPLTPAEYELRENLRLEEIERRLRSLRAPPIAQTHRDARGSASAGQPGPAAAPVLSADDIAALAADLARSTPPATDADSRPEAGPPIHPSGYTPIAGTLDTPLPDSANLPEYDNPPRFTTPVDPPGWERIYEGSVVEAVLVTQLTGDFPSPVLATVAVPFYSTDRQRVLLPRGSRFLGAAQPVRGQDQDRLAIGFHRVILPDGKQVALRFQGLNQAGEGALADQVDRHYLSTFLAAGAVGVLSGLAAIGSNPYGGGIQAYRAGVAQSTGQSGLQVMRRFLNRYPDVTIRAGHRLRIWFTSDTLFPRTQEQP